MVDDKTIIASPEGVLTILSAQKRFKACLVQYSGANLGRRYMLDEQRMVIGRSPDSQIVINEQCVSRQHAQCLRVNEKVVIEDLGSSNGTYLNDEKLTNKQTLKDGDIIRLGTIVFKYFSHDNIENVFTDKIYRMATIDSGTGTFNKKYLMEALENEFKYAKTYSKELSIIYFDLDHFKKVNDTYGHNAGDFILKEVANTVRGHIRKDDIFCRFGGEEFVILLPNTNAKTAYDLAERIRKTLEVGVFDFNGEAKIKQTVSLGVSQLAAAMATPNDLLNDADRKLYASKKNGRNRITI
jgi:diguanylate cyclase (GGDEF)-like protein